MMMMLLDADDLFAKFLLCILFCFVLWLNIMKCSVRFSCARRSFSFLMRRTELKTGVISIEVIQKVLYSS